MIIEKFFFLHTLVIPCFLLFLWSSLFLFLDRLCDNIHFCICHIKYFHIADLYTIYQDHNQILEANLL